MKYLRIILNKKLVIALLAQCICYPTFHTLFSQQIDSALYHQIKNDSRIVGFHYAQLLYKNGKVREEGWEYKKRNNRADGKHWAKQYDKFPFIAFRFGEWKEYYKSGILKMVSYIPLRDDSIRTEKHFNRKGELAYEFYFAGTEELNYKLTKKGARRKLKNYKKLEYRKGKLWMEENYKEGKKDGVWKEYYKEGTVVINEYSEGKKIRKEIQKPEDIGH